MTKSIMKCFPLFFFTLLAFYGCFSPYKGDEATLTLLLGNSPRAAITDGVVHTIELDGPSGPQSHKIEGAKPFSVTVAPGYWKISIKAYLGDILYAEGEGGADIKAGQNNQVEIKMSLVYTVTFNGNGATGTVPAPITQTAAGAALSLPGPGALVKTDCTFGGWSESPTGIVINGPYTPTSDKTLYAIWNQVQGPALYTVYFAGNGNTGGTVPAPITQTAAGAALSLPGPGTLVKTDFIFGGWSESQTPTTNDTVLQEGDAYIPNSDTTLYAKWIQVFTVTFNGNGNTGGSAPTAITQESKGAEITLPNQGSLVRTGYTFAGWSETATGNVLSGAAYTPTKTITLYAIWNRNAPTTYTVTFDRNGANNDPPPAMTWTSEDEPIKLPGKGNLARNGFAFSGWSISRTPTANDTIWKEGAAYTPTRNITLYAIWDVVYTVYFHRSGDDVEGTVPASMTQTSAGEAIKLPGKGDLSIANCIFGGWSVSPAPSPSVAIWPAETDYKPIDNITLYAIWYQDVHIITFYRNGASGDTPGNITAEEKELTLPYPEWLIKDGYTFGGWSVSTNPTATDIIWRADEKFYPTRSITLYAVWNRNP